MKNFDFLRIKIDDEERESFMFDRISTNIYRARLLAIILIIFELFLTLLDLSALIYNADHRFHFIQYLTMYLLMILINLIYYLNLKWAKDSNSTKQLKYMDRKLIVYMTLVLSWGSVVSLLDQELYGQLIVFMVNMITCSVLFVLESRHFIIPYGISTLILVVGLPFFQRSKDILIGHYVNLVVFIVLSWIASRIMYNNYYNDFRSKTLLRKANYLLEREIDKNILINKELKMANLHLSELALIDELTGISNRRSFRNFIDLAFENYIEGAALLSVVMIDIDYFKQYNDHYGHAQGDQAINEVAQQINSVVRHQRDTVARWGGEEFLYAGFNINEEEIQAITETIHSKVLELKIPHEYSKASFYLSVSIGYSSIEVSQKSDVAKGIECADKALYIAKMSGRNCIRKYQE